MIRTAFIWCRIQSTPIHPLVSIDCDLQPLLLANIQQSPFRSSSPCLRFRLRITSSLPDVALHRKPDGRSQPCSRFARFAELEGLLPLLGSQPSGSGKGDCLTLVLSDDGDLNLTSFTASPQSRSTAILRTETISSDFRVTKAHRPCQTFRSLVSLVYYGRRRGNLA